MGRRSRPASPRRGPPARLGRNGRGTTEVGADADGHHIAGLIERVSFVRRAAAAARRTSGRRGADRAWAACRAFPACGGGSRPPCRAIRRRASGPARACRCRLRPARRPLWRARRAPSRQEGRRRRGGGNAADDARWRRRGTGACPGSRCLSAICDRSSPPKHRRRERGQPEPDTRRMSASRRGSCKLSPGQPDWRLERRFASQPAPKPSIMHADSAAQAGRTAANITPRDCPAAVDRTRHLACAPCNHASILPPPTVFRKLWLIFAQTCTICLGAAVRGDDAASRPAAAFLRRATLRARTSSCCSNRRPPGPARRSDSFTDAVHKAMPAVVNIYTSKEATRPAFRAGRPAAAALLSQVRRGRAPQRATSLGSGVDRQRRWLHPDQHHVVEAADEIEVVLATARLRPRCRGTDPETDLAVLKIAADEPAGDHLRRHSTTCRSATSCSPSAIRSASARP